MVESSLSPDGLLGPRSEHGAQTSSPNYQPKLVAQPMGPMHPRRKRRINPPRRSSGRSSHGERCRCLVVDAWWGGRAQCSRRVHAGF